MADRLLAHRGFLYPADAESLVLVRAAGGLSRMTEADRARVTFRRVEPGDYCDDMPVESQARYLFSGDIERVSVAAAAVSHAAIDGEE